jgi:hypothetical protein
VTEIQDTQLKIHPEAVFTQLEGQVVILQYDSGTYYALNEVGARVWQLLEQGKTLRDIVALLLGEYQVSEAQLAQDLTKLVRDLQKEGLVL